MDRQRAETRKRHTDVILVAQYSGRTDVALLCHLETGSGIHSRSVDWPYRLHPERGFDTPQGPEGLKMGLQNLARLSVLAFIAVAVAGVLLRPLAHPDEARYMAVAWEMYQSGNYFVPTKNLELYTDKPPLLFWTINLVWSLLGVSEIAARLVGPFYALVALVLTGLLAKRIWPDDTEIHARALLVLSSLLIFSVLGGLTMFDAMLTVAVLIGLHALVLWVDTGALRCWVMFGFALALGVLAKGPVIFFHLAPAMLTIPFWANAQTPIGCRRALSGAGLALLAALGLVGLWVVPAALIGGQEYRDAILSSPRRPAKTMRIFSSAEYVCLVLRRMFLTSLSAASFDVPDFLVISNSQWLR
jgi:hypothetical protein